MKEQVKIFFTALMFYSRIPCPGWVGHSEAHLHKATRYFPLVGWIVAGFASLFYLAFCYLNLPVVGIFFSMIASIWITGAFHEDGFADVCDGFGGGHTKESILKIMKDSRIGAYGTMGLILILGLKFLLLYRLSGFFMADPRIMTWIFVSGHALSRFAAATFIYTHEYAREGATSKIKAVSKRMSKKELAMAGLFGLSPLFVFDTGNLYMPALMLPVLLVKWCLGRYFQKRLGGYTGDCLGATQQVTEIVFYLALLIFWSWNSISLGIQNLP